MKNLNDEVTQFLDELDPLENGIQELRIIILKSVKGLTENIK